jgi:redox-sensitive bicupin YhaK (pirin superfamily)
VEPRGPDVRRSADRYLTTAPGLESRHAFSFGRHYDPDDTGHGLLLAHNDERVAPGAGFGPHPHQEVEVVTWVLDGVLAHEDSTGRAGTVRPGQVQRMTAGRGVVHAERNGGAEPLRFVQAWLQPDEPGLEPGYEQIDVPAGRGLLPVASGLGHEGAVRLHARAVLWVGRLAAGETVAVPRAPSLHLFVARGRVVHAAAGGLAEGDAVRSTAGGGEVVRAEGPAELLLWEMHPPARA